jgi:transposase
MRRRGAARVVAALGTDLSRVPRATHLATWAGRGPGNTARGGTRVRGKTRPGQAGLRQVVIEIAHVAAKTKETAWAAQDRRMAARRGTKRARSARGQTILGRIYHLLTRRERSRDLGVAYFEPLARQRGEQRLGRRLARLGDRVTLQPPPETPEVAA